jgi:hypothetical protein
MANLLFSFEIPAGASAYDAWVVEATANDYPQPTNTVQDMFDWLASQAAADITASASITSLPAGSTPTVTITVS